MMHPNSLRNLKRPLPGEVRNPRGINQYTKDRERRQAFRALCMAMDDGSEEVRDAILSKLTELFVEGAIAGDTRLLLPYSIESGRSLIPASRQGDIANAAPTW